MSDKSETAKRLKQLIEARRKVERCDKHHAETAAELISALDEIIDQRLEELCS